MAVYGLGDTHFRHGNCLRFRTQFSTMDEHDNTILDNILTVCGKRDSLYLMGDVFVGPGSMDYLITIAEKVEHVHIVLGNHDDERKGAPTIRDLLKYCKNVYGLKKYKTAWLSHCPIHPQELRGKFNIHGHLHDVVIDDTRYYNVSCEQVGYKPINFATVLEELQDVNGD